MNKVVIDIEARFTDNASSQTSKTASSIDALKKRVDELQAKLDRLKSGRVRLKFDADNNPLLNKVKAAEDRARKLGKTKTRMVLDAADKASHVIGKALAAAKRFGSGVYTARLLLRDTGVGRAVGSAVSKLKQLAAHPWTAVMKIKDFFTAPLRKLEQKLFSIKSLVTAVFAGAAFNKFVANPVSMYADYEDLVTQFSVMLGSQSAAEKRMSDLVSFAGETPFTRDEIFQASRVLQTYTGGKLATPDSTGGLRTIGDVAAMTGQDFTQVANYFGRLYNEVGRGGTALGEPLMLLREIGAVSAEGEERIKKIAQGSGTIDEKWAKIAGEFSSADGMMLAMSDQMNNLLLGVKTFAKNNLWMKIGSGISKSLKPFLSDFRKWRGENSDIIQKFATGVEDLSAKISGKLLGGVRKVTSSAWELLRSPEFKSASLEGKAGMLWDWGKGYARANILDPLSAWWNGGGRDKTVAAAGRIGADTGKLLGSALTGIFGGVSSGVDFMGDATSAGGSVARAFIDGFKANFDGEAVKASITGALSDVWNAIPTEVKFLLGLSGGGKLTGGLMRLITNGNTLRSFFGSGGGGLGNITAGTMNVSAGAVYVNGPTMGGTDTGTGYRGDTNRTPRGGGYYTPLPWGSSGGAGGAPALPPAKQGLLDKLKNTRLAKFLSGAKGSLGKFGTKALPLLGLLGGGALGLTAGAGGLIGTFTAGSGLLDILNGDTGSGITKMGGAGLGALIGTAFGGPVGAGIGAGLGGVLGMLNGEGMKIDPKAAERYRSRLDPFGGLTTSSEAAKKAAEADKGVTSATTAYSRAVNKANQAYRSKDDPMGFNGISKSAGKAEAAIRKVASAAKTKAADTWRNGTYRSRATEGDYTTNATVKVNPTIDNDFTSGLHERIQGAVDGVKGTYSKVVSVLATLGAKVSDNATGAIGGAVGKIRSVWSKAVSVAATLSARVRDGASAAIGAAVAAIKSVWTKTVTVVTTLNSVLSGGGNNRTYGPKYRGGIVGGSSAYEHFATGGIVRGGARLVQVAEEGSPEMIIPLSSQRRERGRELWEKAGHMLRVPGFATGGLVDGRRERLSRYASGYGADNVIPFSRYSRDNGIRSQSREPSPSAAVTGGPIDVGGVTIQKIVFDLHSENAQDVMQEIRARSGEIADIVAGELGKAISGVFRNTPLRGGAAG